MDEQAKQYLASFGRVRIEQPTPRAKRTQNPQRDVVMFTRPKFTGIKLAAELARAGVR